MRPWKDNGFTLEDFQKLSKTHPEGPEVQMLAVRPIYWSLRRTSRALLHVLHRCVNERSLVAVCRSRTTKSRSQGGPRSGVLSTVLEKKATRAA